MFSKSIFQQDTSIPLPWANSDDGPPDVHAHCPSCSGTHRLSLLLTSLPPHAETPFHTVPQHLQAYKTDEPPILEHWNTKLSFCVGPSTHE